MTTFSSRTRWNFTRNRLADAIAARRAAGLPLLDLTESNPTHAGLHLHVPEELFSLASPESLDYSPEPQGLLSAREAVADYYRARGVAVEPSRVVLSTSTSEAYGWLFKLLCDPGDAVLVPRPSYPLFDDLARLEDVALVPYTLAYDGAWHLDVGSVRSALTPRVRAVLTVHPNNPTGSFLKREELAALRELCRAHDLAIVSDEVFADYAYGPDPARAPSLATVDDVLTFTLSGLSKVVALPQMKLGWVVVNGPGALVTEALRRLEQVADCYLSVATPVQHAARTLLATHPRVRDAVGARVATNRARLATVTHGSAATLLSAEGGWYAVLRVPRTHTEEEWAVALVGQDGVLAHPGYFFDFPSEAYLVVSLLTPEDVFREGVARLMERVART